MPTAVKPGRASLTTGGLRMLRWSWLCLAVYQTEVGDEGRTVLGSVEIVAGVVDCISI